jgi:uncharacterized RDD family membrane protein YckC
MHNQQPLQESTEGALTPPSLLKLGASLVYDCLVVIALCFALALLFIGLLGDATQGGKRYFLQSFLCLSVGLYFVWCWLKSGQTLAMQTWHLKLVDQHGQLLTPSIAVLRYGLACLSLMLFGLGFLWVLVDRDRMYLHDRLLGSRIINCYLRST